MKFKKSIVSTLSISALALSISGVASAKEVDNSTVLIPEGKQASFLLQDKISIQNYPITLRLGEEYDIPSHISGAKSWKSDNSYVASVTGSGIIRANNPGDAKITVFKSNGTVLGAIFVHVPKL